MCSDSSWYQQALNDTDVVITEPYLSTGGNMVISIVTKVTDTSGKALGFVAIDISTERLNQMMEEYYLGETGFFMLITKNGMIMHHPDQQLEGKNISESDISQNFIDILSTGQASQIQYTTMGQNNYGYISPISNIGWTIATGLPQQEYFSSYYGISKIIYIIFSVGLLGGKLIQWEEI